MIIGIPIEEIDGKLRPASEMRCKLDSEAIEDYASKIAKLPPVKLMRDNTDQTWWVVDGAHTITAARKAGKKDIQAECTEGTYLDAWNTAAHENQSHGVPIRNKDKHHRVELALKHPVMKTWSDNRIAKACAVTQPLVSKIKQLITVISCPPVATVGLDGRTRKPPKPRTPKAAKAMPTAAPTSVETAQPDVTRKPAEIASPQSNGHAAASDSRSVAVESPVIVPNPSMPFNSSKHFMPLRVAILDAFDEWPKEQQKSFARELCSIAEELKKQTGLVFQEVTLGVGTN